MEPFSNRQHENCYQQHTGHNIPHVQTSFKQKKAKLYTLIPSHSRTAGKKCVDTLTKQSLVKSNFTPTNTQNTQRPNQSYDYCGISYNGKADD